MAAESPQCQANGSPTCSVRSSCRRWMDDIPPVESVLEKADEPKPARTDSKRSVFIDHESLEKLAAEITDSIVVNNNLEVAEWDADGWHYTGCQQGSADDPDCLREVMRMERVALYILSLDAINFCFWPLSSDEDAARGVKNGLEYEHLAIALRRVAELDDGPAEHALGTPTRAAPSYALHPGNLSQLTPETLSSLLSPHFPKPPTQSETVRYELPDIEVRCRLLNELGSGLLERHDGSALNMISKANRSADALVSIILDTFPGFRDCVNIAAPCDSAPHAQPNSSVSSWPPYPSPSVIHFYKRAQIAVADIWAALGRSPRHSHHSHGHVDLLKCCQFTDIQRLTTFPDYRVPQILRNVGALRYCSSLAKAIDNHVELTKGGVDEVSIRAGTVVAVEELVTIITQKLAALASEDTKRREDLQKLSEDVSAVTIDWYLWQQGEKLDRLGLLKPHHRVRTSFY